MNFYFLKGIAEGTGSISKLKEVLYLPVPVSNEPELEMMIDLKEGIEAAEERIDQKRPAALKIYLGKQYIGTLLHQYGYERLRGAHLRASLAKSFKWEIVKALAADGLQERKASQKRGEQLTKEEIYEYTGA